MAVVAMQPLIKGNRGKVFPVGQRDATIEDLFGDVFSTGPFRIYFIIFILLLHFYNLLKIHKGSN
jgi:hypothetical protein